MPEIIDWQKRYGTAAREHLVSMESELKDFVSEEELKDTMSRINKATHLVRKQSQELRELRAEGYIDDFRLVEMQRVLEEFYNLQGKSERIKNFPLPRQYATMSVYFLWLFIFMVPLSMLSVFAPLMGPIGVGALWISVPASVMVCWVFHTMERIGDFSENPFEGLVNDVPITSLSRTIERDLRDMLDETDIPEPLGHKNFSVT